MYVLTFHALAVVTHAFLVLKAMQLQMLSQTSASIGNAAQQHFFYLLS